MDSPDRQAVAILAGVNKFETSTDIGTQNSTYGVKERTFPLEGDFKAGDIPRTGENKSEIMGLAVFDGDKMVGELDGEETAYYLMVTGEYKNAYWTLPDPMVKGKYVLLNIKQQRSPMKKVSYVNRKPQVSIKLLLESDISSIQSGLNYERDGDKSVLEKSSADFITAGIKKLLDKTAKEFHSDIFGLGSGMRSKFLTLQEFDNFNWKSKYKDSGFNVDVTMKIRRTGLLVRTVKASNSKGEGG
jgi:Spore germination B3/ GerAC like, C-terminal.